MTRKTPEANDLKDKKVLLRLDLDVPIQNGAITDSTRLDLALESLKFSKENAQKTLIIGHLGRPEGVDLSLSLKPIGHYLGKALGTDIPLLATKDELKSWLESPITLAIYENLRFDQNEDDLSDSYAQALSSDFDVFINDAFAVSHRQATSIVLLPNYLNSFLGFNFKKEIEALGRVVAHPIRPITIILGGKKTDKISFVDNFSKIADNLLIGGRLMLELNDQTISNNTYLATLTPQGTDISVQSAHQFAEIIKASKTIFWNGPMGKFEDQAFSQGTRIIADAIIDSKAYSIIGGGDTISAIKSFKLENHFHHLSSAGGALLHYLAYSTLPGLEALDLSPIK